MNRIADARYSEAIAEAFDGFERVPRIAERVVHVDFLCGLDPNFVGLHDHKTHALDGRAYASTAHCAYRHNQKRLPADRRRTTIVLPAIRWADTLTIWHELGHALHETIDFDCAPRAITEYAERNRYEAFAEAFCAWRCPWFAGIDLATFDPETHELFEYLAA